MSPKSKSQVVGLGLVHEVLLERTVGREGQKNLKLNVKAQPCHPKKGASITAQMGARWGYKLSKYRLVNLGRSQQCLGRDMA